MGALCPTETFAPPPKPERPRIAATKDERETLCNVPKQPSYIMPAAPPNVDSIRQVVSARSQEQSFVESLKNIDKDDFERREYLDESELEIPPGADTPWSFGSFIRYFGPGWLVCIVRRPRQLPGRHP